MENEISTPTSPKNLKKIFIIKSQISPEKSNQTQNEAEKRYFKQKTSVTRENSILLQFNNKSPNHSITLLGNSKNKESEKPSSLRSLNNNNKTPNKWQLMPNKSTKNNQYDNIYVKQLDQFSDILNNPLITKYLLNDLSNHDSKYLSSHLSNLTNKAFELYKQSPDEIVPESSQHQSKASKTIRAESLDRKSVYQKCFAICFNILNELISDNNKGINLSVNLNLNTIIENGNSINSQQQRKQKNRPVLDESRLNTNEGSCVVNDVSMFKFTVSKQENGNDVLLSDRGMLSPLARRNFTQAKEALLKSCYREDIDNNDDLEYLNTSHHYTVNNRLPYYII